MNLCGICAQDHEGSGEEPLISIPAARDLTLKILHACR